MLTSLHFTLFTQKLKYMQFKIQMQRIQCNLQQSGTPGECSNARSSLTTATLHCNVSLITCFLTLLFHKVVWQHTQGVVGFLINRFTANLLENQLVKGF